MCIAFDKYFYICDVVVAKSLYNTFSNVHKEQFAFQVQAFKNNYKIGFLGNFG